MNGSDEKQKALHEALRYNTVALRTSRGEVYAVAVKTGSENGVDTWAVGFAVCMPEDQGLPRQRRLMSGYWKAKKRAESTNPAFTFTAPTHSKIYPVLRNVAIRAVLDEIDTMLHPEGDPIGYYLGFAPYNGHGDTSRLKELFAHSPFTRLFTDRFATEVDDGSDQS